MKTLIVGAGSGIGQALYSLLPESDSASRHAGHTYQINVTDISTYPQYTTCYNRVYYCAGVVAAPIDTVNVNALMSYEFLRHLAPNVDANGTVVILSSSSGSIGSAVTKISDSDVYYKISKAALNMATVILHHQFPNINWQLVDPGLTETNMTRHFDPVGTQKKTAIETAKLLIDLPVSNKLSFVDNLGRSIPW